LLPAKQLSRRRGRFTGSSPNRSGFVTPIGVRGVEASGMRASVALGMMLVAVYAVATLQWWGLVPAVTALVVERRSHRSS
jgi:hypothetical protein